MPSPVGLLRSSRIRGSLEESENLPEPEVLAQEIADDLEAALEQFQAISSELETH